MNLRFQNALKGRPQAIPPIWMMRQAGRYHSHYQKLRQAYSFMDLCKQPRLASEVALGPVMEFDFDVAILFSDLLFPLEAMGMGLTYDPAPRLSWSLDSETIGRLKPLREALPKLEFQGEALRETRRQLPSDKSLIGFVGGPWTLFTYAVEGAHKGQLLGSKSALPLFARFSELVNPLLEANIELQLKAGAEVVMIFDTAAGELSAGLFRAMCEKTLVGFADKFLGRIGYYAKGVSAETISGLRAHANFAGFGFDHRWDLAGVLRDNAQGFVQGNFDQALLTLPPMAFAEQLEHYLAPLKMLTPIQRRHWVCGLGHGVLPSTPQENVAFLVKRIREVFR